MKRYLPHLLIALVVFLATCGVYAAWYFMVRDAANRSAVLALEVEQSVNAVTEAADTRDTLVLLAEDEAAINAHFVVVSDIALFLEELEATGRGLGSSINVVSVADKPSADNRIMLTLRIRGSYESVLRTIGALEYGPRDTRVESLTLDLAKESEGGGWVAAGSFSVGTASSPPVVAPAPAST